MKKRWLLDLSTGRLVPEGESLKDAAWRENDHDDTVLAAALADALWAGAAERIVPRELWIY